MADNTSQIAGLFMTPEMYQQQQNQNALASFAQQAQMDPFQRATMSNMYGGYQLGNALAGALGGQDPMLQALTARKQVAQNIDWTKPESIAAGAQSLAQSGDTKGALLIAEEGRAAQLKMAQAAKASGAAGATTVSERNRTLIQQAEVKLAKGEKLTPEEEANARWLVAQESKPKIFRDNDTGEIIKIDPLDISSAAPNLAKAFGKQAASGVAPQAAGVTSTAASKVDTGTRKELGNVDQSLVDLDTSINKIASLTPKIEEVNLGLTQNLERGIRGFFGRPTEDTKQFKELQREIRKQSNNLLLLAKGTQTEGDAQRARDQLADEDTWKNKELLTAAFNDLQTTLKNTQGALMAKRQTLTSSGIPQAPNLTAQDVAPKPNPLSGANPQLQPAPSAPAATHRFNIKTGRVEKL